MHLPPHNLHAQYILFCFVYVLSNFLAQKFTCIRKSDGCRSSAMDGQRTKMVDYLSSCTRCNLQAESSEMMAPWRSQTSLEEVRDVVAGLRDEKVAGVCSIMAELLQVGDEAVTRKLHALFTSFMPLVPFLLTGKGSWPSLSAKKKETLRTATATQTLSCSAGKARLSLICCLCALAVSCRHLKSEDPRLASRQLTVSSLVVYWCMLVDYVDITDVFDSLPGTPEPPATL